MATADPYSADGELVNIHTAFHQSQHQSVIDFDVTPFSSTSALPAQLLQLRSQIALGQYSAVIAATKSNTPDLVAARLLATYLSSPGSASKTIAEAQKLAASSGDSFGVQIFAGTLLATAGEYEDALTLLKRHQGSLDAVALIVQVHLAQNRTDLALKEIKAARSWAGDVPVVNLGEAWVAMREGGEKYQQAYYVFEELASAPSTPAPAALVAQAVSELHLGRYPEAETALQQALSLNPEHQDALAASAVLSTIQGKTEEAEQAVKKLEAESKGATKHPLVSERERMKAAFETAAAKYSPKFEP